MEKYYHLNTQQEEENTGAFVDPYFDSSSPFGISSLQSIKPLVFDNPNQATTTPLISSDSHLKRPSLESITNSTSLKIPKTETDNVSSQPPLFELRMESNSGLCRQRELGRERRKRVREKIERLKEVLPWKGRMDTARVLENAGKYIKYLEAQVRVLEGMAVDDCSGLGLERNRMLQIMVKSEVIQGKMSSEEMCVYSVEQLVEMIAILFNPEEASVLLNSILFSSTFAPPPPPLP